MFRFGDADPRRRDRVEALLEVAIDDEAADAKVARALLSPARDRIFALGADVLDPDVEHRDPCPIGLAATNLMALGLERAAMRSLLAAEDAEPSNLVHLYAQVDVLLARDRRRKASEAADLALTPVRAFLMESTRERDLHLFLEVSGTGPVEDLDEIPMTTLLPSYMLSELRTAFEIGFMIYLPFLVIDLVIASMLISMGMIVLPPIVISLPFKLMLFVLLDGWNLVLGSLISGLR